MVDDDRAWGRLHPGPSLVDDADLQRVDRGKTKEWRTCSGWARVPIFCEAGLRRYRQLYPYRRRKEPPRWRKLNRSYYNFRKTESFCDQLELTQEIAANLPDLRQQGSSAGRLQLLR